MGIAAAPSAAKVAPNPGVSLEKWLLLAESDRRLAANPERERKFYGRKLDLKSNQVPGQRASLRPQPSAGQWWLERPARAQVEEGGLPTHPQPPSPGSRACCLPPEGKDQDPRAEQAEKGPKQTFVQDEHQGEGVKRAWQGREGELEGSNGIIASGGGGYGRGVRGEVVFS